MGASLYRRCYPVEWEIPADQSEFYRAIAAILNTSFGHLRYWRAAGGSELGRYAGPCGRDGE